MKRKVFLDAFLGALGAEEVKIHLEDENKISGEAIYDPNDIEERQDFIWKMSEESCPTGLIVELANYLRVNRILDIDRIPIPRIDLFQLFNTKCSTKLNQKEFDELLDELEMVEVTMVDDGEETDRWYIHE
jgi:hypothetical protein